MVQHCEEMSYHLTLAADVALEEETIKTTTNRRQQKHLPYSSRQLEWPF